MSRKASFLSLLACLPLCVSAFATTPGSVNFLPVVTYFSGGEAGYAPGSIAIADLNGDENLT